LTFLTFFSTLAAGAAAPAAGAAASSAIAKLTEPRNNTAINATNKRFIKSLLEMKIVVDHYFKQLGAKRRTL
jgi:hypothetical protein